MGEQVITGERRAHCSAASSGCEGEKEALSSSPWDPETEHLEQFKALSGEVQTGHEEAFLYQEGG